jgi:hypothetical protein
MIGDPGRRLRVLTDKRQAYRQSSRGISANGMLLSACVSGAGLVDPLMADFKDMSKPVAPRSNTCETFKSTHRLPCFLGIIQCRHQLNSLLAADELPHTV